MKKITISFIGLFALLVSISSCTKDPIGVKYDLGTKEACLDADPYQKYFTFTYVVQQSDLKAAVKAAGAEWDLSLIKTVNLKGLKAQVQDSNKNLDQIASVEVYVREDNATTDGTQVAYSENIGGGVTEVSLSPNGANLKEWLDKDHINLYVKVLNGTNGNDAICLNLSSGYIEFEVSAK